LHPRFAPDQEVYDFLNATLNASYNKREPTKKVGSTLQVITFHFKKVRVITKKGAKLLLL
jgi:hypothetical protein